MKLLYIDDTESDLVLMGALLKQQKVEIETANSGERGIAMYDPKKHSAVLIDWNLLGMQGIDAARRLLQMYPECPIAFISGLYEERHLKDAQQLGITRCFEKNVDMKYIDQIRDFVHEFTFHKVKHVV